MASDTETCLKSLSGSGFSLPLKCMLGAFSLILLGGALMGFFTNSGTHGAYKFFVGAACLYALGFRKNLYLCDEGVVKESRTFLNRSRNVLPWSSICAVTLAYRGDKMMVLLEVDVTGWKLLYSRSDEAAVRSIIGRHLPGMEIETVGK